MLRAIMLYCCRFALVAIAYVLAGKLGLTIPYWGSHITLIWLPTGIAVAALLRLGLGLLPAIFAGSVMVNLLIGSAPSLALMIGVGNTLGPLLTYALLKWWRLQLTLHRGTDVLLIIFAAAVGMVLSATGGTLSLLAAGLLAPEQLLASWVVWWAGDTVGVLIVLPILLTLSLVQLKLLWQMWVQYLGWCTLVSLLEIAILVLVPNPAVQFSLMAVFMFPLVIWSAMRFGLAGSSLAVLGLSLIAVLATIQTHGPFYQANMHQGIISLWIFMCALSLVTLIINILQNERLAFEAALLTSETKLRAIINGALDAIITIDERGKIVEFNPAAERIFGYTREQVLDRPLGQIIVPPSMREMHNKGHQHYFKTGEKRVFDQRLELTAMRADKTEFPVELTLTSLKGDGTQLVTGFIRDITERRHAESEIKKLAFYEVLTGLPNRRLLLDRLTQALVRSVRTQHYGAILFVDLDNFKALNDSRGHEMGDQLLVEVAQRIKQHVREEDTVSRFGGDEFVVLLEDLSDEHDLAMLQARQVTEKLLHMISKPYQLSGFEHHSSSSIGISLFLGNEIKLDELLKRADTAMYQAKASGRNTLRFFDPSMQVAIESQVEMESQLRRALALDQMSLHYQIQVDEERHIVGAEALLRWDNPRLGMIPPVEFIPVAEESGLIVPIGTWVIEQACRQLKRWEKTAFASDIKLAVNVSARQFRHPDFVKEVRDAIEKTGANPTLLKLELTESIVIDDVLNTIQKMQELQLLGLNFSLDDFGTGYSSLTYLKQLPLTQIKVDQSFVRDIVFDSSDAAIVKAIIVMSAALGFNVIAEGVENDAQFDILRGYGCRQFQGYLFGKPMAVDVLEALLQKNKL